MTAVQEIPDFRDNLSYFQEESLKIIALLAGAVAYAWLHWNVASLDALRLIHDAATISSWIGALLLALSVVVSYALRGRRLHVATHLLVWGMLSATACAVLTFPSAAVAYLLILPIVFGSVLLSQPAFFLVAIVTGLLTLAIDPLRTGVPLFSAGTKLPVAIIASVAISAWLSVRNLHVALAWVWNGYERARRNERTARERQAELQRVLKALDEAYHRLERVNYMLVLARDEAEEARRLKQQFAQTISHELRTPLNLIVGFTELMAETPEYYGGHLPPAYLHDLSIVYRNACHLQDLVNDVLDLARIEAAQMNILPEETDPAALVQETVETAHSLVEARGLALRVEIEPGLPSLWVDPTRIRQVLFNLLNNAVRFTEEGSVTVSAHRRGEDVVFAVADTGVGIAPEDVDRVFEEFQQVDGSTRRRHEGAGLGLAISRRFVELHGGHMWVESQMGQGSTFHFSLPVERANLAAAPGDRPAEGTAAKAVSARGSEEPVLLAVTRSLSAATLLTHYVHGCRTVVVPDLEEARHTAQRLMPQAVVVDRTCEDIDEPGLEALAREWGLSRAPLIACPLPGEEPLRQRLAVDGYLVKPVSRQSVWDVMRRLGENVDSVLVVDDDHDFVRLLNRMLEDSPVRRYHVISAYSGQQALVKMRQRQPDLVVLDLGLPDIGGLEFIERVRSNPGWQHIPIVIVSAQGEADGLEVLKGTMSITKADGMMPGEVVRWVQNVVDTAVTSLPAPPAPRAAPASTRAFPERQ